ncbi:MAG: hypothetical protein QXR60_02575 [Candidatus Nanoarchaeia archaeon]
MKRGWLVLALVVVFAFFVIATYPTGSVDFFQVGDSADETVHKASGWGPVEPDTHGGNWGGLASSLDPLTDKKARVVWAPDEPDHFEERGAEFTMTVAKKCALPFVCNRQFLRASTLKLKYLDGIANDDFVVLWKNTKTGNWEVIDVVVTDPSTDEQWLTREINLVDKIPAQARIGGGKQLTFRIVATGNAWNLKSTYGQVAFDYIWLEQ